jgi:single-stranded-DNA-specific exonuclease
MPVQISRLNRLLPLVAIGTVADCQSILEPTNRLLVKAGLQIIQRNQHKIDGLTELLVQTELSSKIENGYILGSSDLGFTFSPILNSSGRISHAKLSISVLLGHKEDENAAQELFENTRKLIETNTNRKQMVKDILLDLEEQAELQKHNPLIWLVGDWSKGIIGLLASRLVNQYNLPVVIISHTKAKIQNPDDQFNFEKPSTTKINNAFSLKKLEKFLQKIKVA